MDRNLALEAVRVTEAAALAAARSMGRGDQHAADLAAAEAMRKTFRGMDVRGRVAIGEGEMDETPMLRVGEFVGRQAPEDPEVDIAVDPLDGTDLCAKGLSNAMSVVAMARGGRFLAAPDIYMERIMVGPIGAGLVDLEFSIGENLQRVADAKGVYVEDLTVAVLDRRRHVDLVRNLREAGARIKLMRDGDIAAAIATCQREGGPDLMMGIGGAREAVISAAALRCAGGDMCARLRPRNDADVARAQDVGITDTDRVYSIEELVSGNVLFAATGITSGDVLQGVHFVQGGARTHSVVMRSKSRTVRHIQAEHVFDGAPDYE